MRYDGLVGFCCLAAYWEGVRSSSEVGVEGSVAEDVLLTREEDGLLVILECARWW